MNISSEHPSASGTWCVFVQMSPTQGVKFYASEFMRDNAAILQRKAHAVGLGPAVGDSCEMPFLSSWERPLRWQGGNVAYGYVTQVVDTETLSNEEYSVLCDLLEEFDISTRDLSPDMNVGKIDGMPVRFDFDPKFYYEENGDDEENSI